MNNNFEDIISEITFFKGQVHFGIPTEDTFINEHDLVFLRKWSTENLLNLARRGAFQVALFSEQNVDPELSPFFDWLISDEKQIAQLKKISEVHSIKIQNNESQLNSKSSAVFLDRDGVVNVDHGYVGEPQKVELMPHISDLISRCNKHHRLVVIITNQSGIGRDFYSEENYLLVMERISEILKESIAKIDHTEFSAFHPQSKQEKYRRLRQFRKPRPGMIHRAAKIKNIDLSKSIFVGDRYTDIQAGILAGIGSNFLLASDQNLEEIQKLNLWIDKMLYKFKMENIFENIVVHVLGGLDEVKI